MTYITQISSKTSIFGSRIMMAFLVLGFIAMQAKRAQAQWTTTGTNITSSNTGNVGVGTASAPINKFQVNKIVRIDDDSGSATGSDTLTAAPMLYLGTTVQGNAFQFNGGGGLDLWQLNGSWGRTVTFAKTGNVGIGTTSPGAKLVTIGNILGGNITSHTQLYSTFDSQNNVLMELGYGTATSNITPFPTFIISKNLTSSSNLLGTISFANSSIANGNEKRLASISSWTDGATNSGALNFYTSNAGTLTERLKITSAGNVGIGTTTPAGRFDVRQVSNSGTLATFLTSVGANEDTYLRGGTSSAVVHIGDVASTTSKLLLMENGGTVGIGTTTPNSSYKLDVQGSLNAAGGLCIAGTCKTNWSQVASQWTDSGSNIHFNTGTVGIGAASPAAPLYVTGNEPSSDYATLRVKPSVTHGGIVIDSANNSTQAHLRFFKNGVPKWQFRAPFQDGVDDLRLYSWAASNDVLSITPSGNLGINVLAPTEKLQVAGNLKLTGTGNIDASGTITGATINAKYQDVAEWVESSQSLGAGTVVVLDHTRSNQVVASSRAYDTRVAGVISLQPGITLGESGATKVLVATTGRVKIKVDASAGPIQIGDLLVTSDVPGVAMKSEPLMLGGVQIHRPGTLIGKALEPLAKGTGEILVLLSLQ